MGRRSRSPGPVAASLPATTVSPNVWRRFDPTGATIDYGSASGNTLDSDHVTLTDDGSISTFTWGGGESWTATKNPAKMAVWWQDTGLKWGQVTEFVSHLIMSTVPTDGLKPTWGVVIGTGIDADDAGWHGAHACMGATSTGNPGFSARINVNNVALVTPGSVFKTAKTWIDISQLSTTVNRIMAVSTWPYEVSTPAFHTTYGNHAIYDSNRVAAPTDPFFVGLCMGTQATASPGSDVTATGSLFYSIHTSGDKS